MLIRCILRPVAAAPRPAALAIEIRAGRALHAVHGSPLTLTRSTSPITGFGPMNGPAIAARLPGGDWDALGPAGELARLGVQVPA